MCRFSPVDDAWQRVALMGSARGSFGLVSGNLSSSSSFREWMQSLQLRRLNLSALNHQALCPQILRIATKTLTRTRPPQKSKTQTPKPQTPCAAKGALVAAGGFDGLTHLASVEMYNVTSNTWVSGPLLTVGRSGLRLVESAGSLYAIGGFDGTNVLPTVERLAPGESQWIQVAPMLEGRRDHAVAVDEATGKIIVTGGFDGAGDLASAEVGFSSVKVEGSETFVSRGQWP
jgi:hypothetical protein